MCLLNSDLDDAEARVEKLEAALKRIRDCEWILVQNRADIISAIAREALE